MEQEFNDILRAELLEELSDFNRTQFEDVPNDILLGLLSPEKQAKVTSAATHAVELRKLLWEALSDFDRSSFKGVSNDNLLALLSEQQQAQLLLRASRVVMPRQLQMSFATFPTDVLALIMNRVPNSTLRALCRVERNLRDRCLDFASRVAYQRQEAKLWNSFLERHGNKIGNHNAIEALAIMELINALKTVTLFSFELWLPRNRDFWFARISAEAGGYVYLYDEINQGASRAWNAVGFSDLETEGQEGYISFRLTPANITRLERLLLQYFTEFHVRVVKAEGSVGNDRLYDRYTKFAQLEHCVECGSQDVQVRASNNARRMYCGSKMCQAQFYCK